MVAPLRVGLIGLGDAGRHHARALAALDAEEALRWSSVCARKPERVAAFREELGVPTRVATHLGIDALLVSEMCDAVIIATPDGKHAEHIERCADAGLHVLVEKPLALTLESAEAAVEVCERNGVELAVGYHHRHHAGHRAMKDRLADLGELKNISVRWAWPDPATDGWRARGKHARSWAFGALGTHGVDLAMWLTNECELSQGAAIFRPERLPDQAVEVVLELAGGVFVHISCAVTHRAPSRVSVTGEQGTIECTGTMGAGGGGRVTMYLNSGSVEELIFEAVCPYTASLRAFMKRLKTDALLEVEHALSNVDLMGRLISTDY